MTQTRLVVAPVVVAALAFVLALLGNRLLGNSTLDVAALTWALVIPLWCAAPTFAGFSWRAFTGRERIRAAVMCALAVGGAAAVLLWQSVSAPAVDCLPSRTPHELVLPSLMVGALVAGFFGLACWFSSIEIAAGRIGRGVIYGAVMQLLVIPFGSGLASLLLGGLCLRP